MTLHDLASIKNVLGAYLCDTMDYGLRVGWIFYVAIHLDPDACLADALHKIVYVSTLPEDLLSGEASTASRPWIKGEDKSRLYWASPGEIFTLPSLLDFAGRIFRISLRALSIASMVFSVAGSQTV